MWARASLDVLLIDADSLTGLLWTALSILLGGYETFKLENSLIGAVYPTSPTNDGEKSVQDTPINEQKARHAKMLPADRGKYFYDYSEYLLALLFRFFCCFTCCHSSAWHKKRVSKLERHEKASERLANDIDIVKLLYLTRISSFLAKLMQKSQ